jgi:5-methyltetrahydropteroyltriglutamate--homocysteine methyltransferase
MGKIITASSGSFPRIGEGENGQKLRKAFHDFDKGELSSAELLEVEQGITCQAIAFQQKAGLDLLTDGQISWHDPVSHIMMSLSGVQSGSMVRFFDTNTYFRQPVITKRITGSVPALADEYNFAQGRTNYPVKPVITGPYTLMRLSINNAYDNEFDLLEDITGVIACEVEELAKEGASVIQIDEPSIIYNPDDIYVLSHWLERLSEVKGEAKLALYTYFGDACPVYEKLQLLPVDIIGLDFTYSDRLIDKISACGTDKTLGVGIIDGRNTKLETTLDVFPALEAVLKASGERECYLNPSCGLEYLPQSRAVAKLKNMVGLRDEFEGGSF